MCSMEQKVAGSGDKPDAGSEMKHETAAVVATTRFETIGEKIRSMNYGDRAAMLGQDGPTSLTTDN